VRPDAFNYEHWGSVAATLKQSASGHAWSGSDRIELAPVLPQKELVEGKPLRSAGAERKAPRGILSARADLAFRQLAAREVDWRSTAPADDRRRSRSHRLS
jgi:hypothetical protein